MTTDFQFKDPGWQRAKIKGVEHRAKAATLGIHPNKLPFEFDCEWCGREFIPNPDLTKQWVCSECLSPRIEAARILRSLPYQATIRRAAYIVESLKVEHYLISAIAIQEIEMLCLARNDRK